MITAETETLILADARLDLARLGARAEFVVPPSIAGDLIVTVGRVFGWATQTVRVRALAGADELAFSPAVEATPPASGVLAVRLVVPKESITPGLRITVGTDAVEASSRVGIAATIEVAKVAGRSGSCGCPGNEETP